MYNTLKLAVLDTIITPTRKRVQQEYLLEPGVKNAIYYHQT